MGPASSGILLIRLEKVCYTSVELAAVALDSVGAVAIEETVVVTGRDADALCEIDCESCDSLFHVIRFD